MRDMRWTFPHASSFDSCPSMRCNAVSRGTPRDCIPSTEPSSSGVETKISARTSRLSWKMLAAEPDHKASGPRTATAGKQQGRPFREFSSSVPHKDSFLTPYAIPAVPSGPLQDSWADGRNRRIGNCRRRAPGLTFPCAVRYLSYGSVSRPSKELFPMIRHMPPIDGAEARNLQ